MKLNYTFNGVGYPIPQEGDNTGMPDWTKPEHIFGAFFVDSWESDNLGAGAVLGNGHGQFWYVKDDSYDYLEQVSELCPVCGQPDNCGDCNHERIPS